MSQLQLRNLSKIYNPDSKRPVTAVKDLDLTVEAGEIVALLGSSGCGKTSTLRMVAGFEDVSTGSIQLGDRVIDQLAPAKRHVAMAFEGYSLYPPLTVRENIGFALKSARVSEKDITRRVDEMAHMLEIDSILDRYPSSISGGQQQRVSLARALIKDAELHLLDEPMGQLEPQLRALLRGRIKHFIKERGHTAILVTHDQTEANALADRIAVMENGVLQQYAPPDTLREKPANLFTGTFIGEPPMNVVNATLSMQGDEVAFIFNEYTQLHYPAQSFSPQVLELLSKHSTLVVGVRPHAVRIATAGTPATVTVNQWLGDQTHIAAEFADITLVAVEHDRSGVNPGDTIHIALSPDDLHLFDQQSGQAIAHGVTPA